MIKKTITNGDDLVFNSKEKSVFLPIDGRRKKTTVIFLSK